MLAVLEIWLKTHFLLKRLEASQVCNYKKGSTKCRPIEFVPSAFLDPCPRIFSYLPLLIPFNLGVKGECFFRLRVFFIACVYFRSLNSYYLTFFLPIAEIIRECPLTYCCYHSDLLASSVFCRTCFFSSASLAPDGSF